MTCQNINPCDNSLNCTVANHNQYHCTCPIGQRCTGTCSGDLHSTSEPRDQSCEGNYNQENLLKMVHVLILQFARDKGLDLTALCHVTVVFMVSVTIHMDAYVTRDGVELTAV